MKKPYRHIFNYLPAYFWGALFLIAVNILGAYIPQLVKDAVDILEAYSAGMLNAKGLSSKLNSILFLMGGSAVLMALLRAKSRHIIFGVGRQVEFDLKKQIFNHILHLEPAFFEKKKAGDLISIISNDVQSFRAVAGFAILNILNSAIAFIVIVPLMYKTHSTLTISFLALIPVLILCVSLCSRSIKAHQEAVQEILAKISNFIEQNLSGINIIKTFGQEAAEIERFSQENNGLLKEYLLLIRARSFISPVMKVIASIGFILLLWLGGKAVIEGTFSFGDFAAFSLYIERLIWPITMLGWLITIIYRVQVSAERIENILNTVPRIADTIDTVRKTTFDSEINFKTLGVKIPKGRKIAIIGAIGSGKSQLARKLMHLKELEAEEILIDAVDLKNINLEDLRRLINMVPQENFLFSASIKENISYAKDLSDFAVESLAKAVGIHDEIMKFENGYETIVGERGITLSGGQRQRLAIARALAINPEVLILDDSLSSVDNAIALIILANINKLRAGKTTIFITHKPQIAELCDEIFVMENGKLIKKEKKSI
jgi:ATP-binding cassette, subfamily B, multidrug efflux pump